MKQISRFALLLALIAPLLLALGGCGHDDTTENSAKGPHVQLNDIDLMINDYEKAANDFAKTAKKFKNGDVSLTMRYIDESKSVRDWQAKLQQTAPRMTPPQAQRGAAISAKVAPILPN